MYVYFGGIFAIYHWFSFAGIYKSLWCNKVHSSKCTWSLKWSSSSSASVSIELRCWCCKSRFFRLAVGVIIDGAESEGLYRAVEYENRKISINYTGLVGQVVLVGDVIKYTKFISGVLIKIKFINNLVYWLIYICILYKYLLKIYLHNFEYFPVISVYLESKSRCFFNSIGSSKTYFAPLEPQTQKLEFPSLKKVNLNIAYSQP